MTDIVEVIATAVEGSIESEENYLQCADAVKQALAASGYAIEKGWQPIETAPKDGHHIQLYRYDIQFVGYYAKAGWCANGCILLDPPPTHWRPLPEAPGEG